MLTTVELTTTALYKDAEMKEAVTEIPAELKAVSAPVAEPEKTTGMFTEAVEK